MPALQQLLNGDLAIAEGLEPEELGGLLLRAYAGASGMFMPNDDDLIIGIQNRHANVQVAVAIRRAISEAIAWLEAQVLIVPADDGNGRNGYRILSRRGRRLASEEGWRSYQDAGLLPKQLLHSKLYEQTYFDFVRGDLDTAIFKAFRLFEVAVRQASGMKGLGVSLMRRAFGPNGPLEDQDADGGEREALCSLAVGAIGAFKNPQSHRLVNTTDTASAVEAIMLANYLLKLTCVRSRTGNPLES